jgi:hypothetical protein
MLPKRLRNATRNNPERRPLAPDRNGSCQTLADHDCFSLLSGLVISTDGLDILKQDEGTFSVIRFA